MEESKLNKLEHRLLSMQVDDIEPLFILCADTKRDIDGVTLDAIFKSLIKLIDNGFCKCIINKETKWQVFKELTLK